MEGRNPHAIYFDEPSLTKQEYRDECDINKIMKRFKLEGGQSIVDQIQGHSDGLYGDFSNVPDYRTARDMVIAANASFMALPAEVRKRFDNDAAVFLDYVDDPRNADELVKMGLVDAKPPVEKPVVPPAG